MSAPVNRWFILVLVCVAQFMVVLDATIVNVALPSIQHGLHFSATSLQWVVNVYTLFFGGFLLLGGRASDLFGRQRLFMTGVAVFTIASLVNGFASSSGLLIAGRALQGLGAALVSPAALSIVMTTFAEGRERTRALSATSRTPAPRSGRRPSTSSARPPSRRGCSRSSTTSSRRSSTAGRPVARSACSRLRPRCSVRSSSPSCGRRRR